MTRSADGRRNVAVVTGAAGQDGQFLTRRLLADGLVVHALVRRRDSLSETARSGDQAARLHVHEGDALDVAYLTAVVRETHPTEIYNLAGQSSVSASFSDPWLTWRTNVEPVISLLEAVRRHSPESVLYQSSSSEMFGGAPDEAVIHDERATLRPQSPYAAAKASAHLACQAYRRSYGLRVACGILFNHESSRRPPTFLSRKVVDHVRRVRAAGAEMADLPPLVMGNLRAQRDWGFAPDYVDGMVAIARQIRVRASVLRNEPEPDTGQNYRDYVLGTGELHAVWQLVDRAFECAGLSLDWDLEQTDPSRWSARFRSTGQVAVVVDPALMRPADPMAIQANATRAKRELGWSPRIGLDVFLREMLGSLAVQVG